MPGNGPKGAKKNELKPWLTKRWCIPPKADAAFVAAMEDVLEVYERPQDPRRPLVCLDEFAKQLVDHHTVPLPAKPGSVSKEDYEYVRRGSVTAFMMYAPLEGWRDIYTGPTGQRTALDYAQVIKKLAEEIYPEAEKIILVQDNLDTHFPASLYKAFPPDQARSLVERFEWHYTPKHGSWLNIAENEIGVFTRTVLKERVGSIEEFLRQIKPGCDRRNELKAKANWQFKAEDARTKMKSSYPSL